MRKDDCHELTAIIQSSLASIVSKLQGLEEKVDKLMQDQVTRNEAETAHNLPSLKTKGSLEGVKSFRFFLFYYPSAGLT